MCILSGNEGNQNIMKTPFHFFSKGMKSKVTFSNLLKPFFFLPNGVSFLINASITIIIREM